MPLTGASRLLHIHIAKTGGSALTNAVRAGAGERLRLCVQWHERQLLNADPNAYDFISGHFGYATASALGGDIVAVVRHPIDRFASMYFFWRGLFEKGIETNGRAQLAKKYSLAEFARIRDEPTLLEALPDSMTFQLAHGYTLAHRRALRDAGRSEEEIYEMATAHADSFAIVGTQERLDWVQARLARHFGFAVPLRHVNVTPQRVPLAGLDFVTIRAIEPWVTMDMALYMHVVRLDMIAASAG
jgi:hypothetical protein